MLDASGNLAVATVNRPDNGAVSKVYTGRRALQRDKKSPPEPQADKS